MVTVSSKFELTLPTGISVDTRYEVKAIRDATRRFGANYKPKITFVICAKRVIAVSEWR